MGDFTEDIFSVFEEDAEPAPILNVIDKPIVEVASKSEK